MKHTVFATLAASGFIAASLSSADARLSGDEISSLIAGKKVILSTGMGSFPLRYAANKRVTGDGRNTGLAKYFAPKETGRWWVKNDRLCQAFPTWYNGKTHCFTITKTGERSIRWVRDDGYSGSAKIQN